MNIKAISATLMVLQVVMTLKNQKDLKCFEVIGSLSAVLGLEVVHTNANKMIILSVANLVAFIASLADSYFSEKESPNIDKPVDQIGKIEEATSELA